MTDTPKPEEMVPDDFQHDYDERQKELNRKILEKVAEDPDFRGHLLEDPDGALEKVTAEVCVLCDLLQDLAVQFLLALVVVVLKIIRHHVFRLRRVCHLVSPLPSLRTFFLVPIQ